MEFEVKYTKKYSPTEKWSGKITVTRKSDHLTEAHVSGRGSAFTILVGDYANGHFLVIPDLNVGCPLSRWEDTFWNTERLSKLMNPVDAATVIYGIRAMMA